MVNFHIQFTIIYEQRYEPVNTFPLIYLDQKDFLNDVINSCVYLIWVNLKKHN